MNFIPNWELLVYTPAVFVRVANKGVTGYGTWKKGTEDGRQGGTLEGKSGRVY
jgi:hypothetical protein